MIVEKIFKKDINSIQESDLEDVIGIPETYNVEFKSVPDFNPNLNPYDKKKVKENHKENILKSVIGFLNSNESGLLVLGIQTKDEIADNIEGINKNSLKQLKSEISLEGFLKDKIKAILSYLDGFQIESKIVEYNGRIVVLIEVLNTNWERIFYSNNSQYVYIRKGKSTKQIPLPDILKLVSERSYPQVYMNFKDSGKTYSNSKEGKLTYNSYKINIVNKGVKTAEKIHSFILICSDDVLDIIALGGYTASLDMLDSKNHGLHHFIQSYNHVKPFQFVFPESNMSRLNLDRIYPLNQYSIGHLKIKEEDIGKIKKVLTLIFENSGFVKQEFVISINGDNIFFKTIKSEFNPYLIA